MKILILGATGLLGNMLYHYFFEEPSIKVSGTVRSEVALLSFDETLRCGLISGVDLLKQSNLNSAFEGATPDVVINCTGLTKHRKDGDDRLLAINVNSLIPHQLAILCEKYNARLIHFSTDCVFSGKTGQYEEIDFADADDVYGRSKWLGEVDYPHAITIRTSMIGPELGNASYGLLEWFLNQVKTCSGFRKAVFSGLPTSELARIIHHHVIPNTSLCGLYHVAAKPINKYELLRMIARIYGKEIEIIPDDQLVIDRSLKADRFQKATGYIAPEWPAMLEDMKRHHLKRAL